MKQLFLIAALSFAVVLQATAALSQRSYGCDRGTGEVLIKSCTGDIQRNPNDATAYYNRGIEYLLMHNFDLAIADITKTIELTRGRTTAHFLNRGAAYLGKGDHERAIADFNTIIESSPRFAPAYESRALVYEKKGDRERAIADYRRAIELSPGSSLESKRGLKRLGAD